MDLILKVIMDTHCHLKILVNGDRQVGVLAVAIGIPYF